MMLKIHKLQSKSKLLLTLGITSICITSGLLALGLFSALTYTPELSHAETVAYRTLDDLIYMQEMTANVCKASAENETKQLIDSRDGKSYWVTKLKDGNCWMTQNLALDLSISRPLTSVDSDVTNSWTPSADTQQGTITKFPSSTDLTFSYNPGEYIYTTPLEQSNCGISGVTKLEGCPNWQLVTGLSKDTAGDERTHYSAGNYYSYEVATASTGKNVTTNGDDAMSSICSKGWKLPTGGNDGQYAILVNGLTANSTSKNNNVRLMPYYFVPSGRVDADSYLVYTGSNGFYWSSMVENANGAYYFGFSSEPIAYHATGRYQGFSVRCVARTEPPETRTLADVEYMQDVTADICANTPEADAEGNNQFQLKDSRDQKTYWVAKLKDGNCWMTQNLAFDISSAGVMADKTDLATDWTQSSNPTYPPVTTRTGKLSGFAAEGSSQGYNLIDSYNPGTNKYCAMDSSQACNMTTSNNGGHDAVGNYYTWNAAVAGQIKNYNNVSINTEVTESICPKEWKLPMSGMTNNVENGSFYNLINQYGLMGDISSANSASQAPLYLTYAGWVFGSYMMETYYTAINHAGELGNYWTSTINPPNNSYSLNIERADVEQTGDKGVYFHANILRQLGMSIRCMTFGGEKQNSDNIQITINPTITLEIDDEIEVEKTDTNPSTAALPVSVASNRPYSVSISSASPSLTSTTSITTIPSMSGGLTSSTNAWGIKLSSDTNYTQITSTPTTFYTATGAEVKTIPFTIGISTSTNLPNGEYSTDITITATQN